jgi:hypothetical protein
MAISPFHHGRNSQALLGCVSHALLKNIELITILNGEGKRKGVSKLTPS